MCSRPALTLYAVWYREREFSFSLVADDIEGTERPAVYLSRHEAEQRAIDMARKFPDCDYEVAVYRPPTTRADA